MPTGWLTPLARISLVLSVVSALAIAVDLLSGRSQKMKIMNLVWPITALWAGPLGLFVYWKLGREARDQKPFWQSVLIGTSHCAAGCTVGDFAGEWIVFLTGVTLGSVLWTVYTFDFVLAYIAGIAFQYYSIAPMRGITGWPALKAALQADTVSLIAFELGMFAWMGFTSEVLFHPRLEPDSTAYWLMMQIAMFAGFLTSFPANWWLIRRRWKEAM